MAKPAPQNRHLGPGDKLGKYDLIRQIAIGGMAELYLARTVGIEGFEKLVVCKRILPQLATNQSFVTMFLDEARLAATLAHPNIAQVHDIGMEDGDYFFAMEYVHGEDLDRVAQQSHEQGVPISLDAALTLVAGLCAGLHYAHEKGVVHRDVSPSNVLVSYDGSVKLVDFGIARMQGRITRQSGLRGKIVYMSPEQCRADVTLDRRSDIYSIGSLLYELTTGRTPFTGETEYAVLNQIVNANVPMPSTIVPSFPPALEQILMRALARDPADRFPTALVLQSAIEDFAHDNRLRISPLTLGRLMGTLFPAKLEEWDHAKAQGAFFVEQHVVQTLIESGKTPDPNDPETRAQLKAMAHQLGLVDPTVMSDPPEMEQTATRQIIPPVPTMIVKPLPFDGPPDARYGAPGTLVSGRPVAHAIDGPQRVPVKRHVTPTNFVRAAPRRKGPILGMLVLAAIAGGVATFIVSSGGSNEPLVIPARPAPEPAPPAPVVEAPPVEAQAPAPVVEAPAAPPAQAPLTRPAKAAVKKPVARPRPKPVAKQPEDKAWDADSPFMPVRSH